MKLTKYNKPPRDPAEWSDQDALDIAVADIINRDPKTCLVDGIKELQFTDSITESGERVITCPKWGANVLFGKNTIHNKLLAELMEERVKVIVENAINHNPYKDYSKKKGGNNE